MAEDISNPGGSGVGGGGFSMGGGFIDVEVRILNEQALDAVGAKVQNLTQGVNAVNVGGGGAAAIATPVPSPAGGTHTGGWGGLPSPGIPTASQFDATMGAGTMSIGSMGGADSTGLKGVIQSLTTDLQALSSTIRAVIDGVGGGAGGGGGGGFNQPAGGGGGGMRGGGFGLWGALSKLTGIPYADLLGGYIGLMSIGQAATGAAEASWIMTHPELVRDQFGQPGSGLGLMNNPQIAGIAGQIQSIRSAEAVNSAVANIPIVGGLTQALGGSYQSFLNAQESQRLELEAGRISATASLGFEVRGLEAEATGDPVAILRQRFDRPIAAAREQAAQAAAVLARTSPTVQQYNVAAAGYGSPGGVAPMATTTVTNPEYARLAAEAAAAADALSNLVNQVNVAADEVQRQQTGRTITVQAAGAAATRLTNVTNINPEAQRDVNRLQRDATLFNAASNFAAHPTGLNWENLSATIKEDKRAAAEDDFNVFQWQRKNIEEIDHFRGMVGYGQQQALYDQQRAAGSLQAQIAAGWATVGRNPFAAAQAQIQGQQESVWSMPVGRARNVAQAGLDAASAQLTAGHNFEASVLSESLQARTAAAAAAENLQPLTAQATLSVARARHEIETFQGTPEQRAEVTATLRAELHAQGALETQQRGGLTAIDMSAQQAIGTVSARGIDLTRERRDRLGSQGVFFRGERDLGNVPQPATPTGGGIDYTKLQQIFGGLFQKVIDALGGHG